MGNPQQKYTSLTEQKEEDIDNDAESYHHWRIPEWFPELDKDVVDHLYTYSMELINFNERLNLISSRTEQNTDQIHFSDSILGGKMLLEHTSKKQIYCFGSGNGFPGLVMAVLAPEREFHLVDGDNRKINFLKYVINRMELKNCYTHHDRIEDFPPNSVDCAVSRALGNISRSLLRAHKICAPGAEYFHFKGSKWITEVSEIPIQICSVWKPSLVGEYQLPESDYRLAIVMTKKKMEDEE